MLEGMADKERDERWENRPLADPDLLIASADALADVTEFEVGQLVQWKPLMKNMRSPRYDEPAVVVSYLTPQELEEVREYRKSILLQEPRALYSPWSYERLDVFLGMLDCDGEFSVYLADSRRFMPFTRRNNGNNKEAQP